MVAMTGSEKQVAWAEKIRDEFVTWQAGVLARSEKDLARELARPKPDAEAVAEYQQFVDGDRAALDAANRQTSAAFWLDTRGQDKRSIALALTGKRPLHKLNGIVIEPTFA